MSPFQPATNKDDSTRHKRPQLPRVLINILHVLWRPELFVRCSSHTTTFPSVPMQSELVIRCSKSAQTQKQYKAHATHHPPTHIHHRTSILCISAVLHILHSLHLYRFVFIPATKALLKKVNSRLTCLCVKIFLYLCKQKRKDMA